MADLQRTVEIIFGAVDQTGHGITSVSKSLDTVVDRASDVTKPLAAVADFALKAETAILSLAAAYGGYASIKAAEFESAQIDLNKVLSDADPAVGEFTKTVVGLSEQYGISAASILQGIANFKQAGFTAKEAAGLQKDALDLMIAGDVAAADASRILISAIKGFGGEASDAARYIESLNNVSNNFATDVGQLAAGMARIAPIANTMGFSFQEATGLLTPLIEIFGSGEQAAEALKTGLLKLVDDAKPVRDALAAIGVAQTDANGQLRSGKDIFYDVANAFTTLDEKQKLFITSQMVGIDQAPRMVLAFDNIAKIQNITATALEKTGSVAKEVGLRLESTANQVNIFKQSFDNLAISIGTGLNTQFGGIIAGSSDVLQALRRIVDAGGLTGFFDALKPAVEDFQKTLDNIAANLPAAFEKVDFSGLLNAFKDLGFEVSSIFDGVDLNTPEGLAVAIQFVADSLESLTRVTSGVIDAWGPMVRELVAGIEAFNNLDDASKKTFGNVSGLADIFETFKGVLTGGLDAVNTIGNALTALAGIKAAETLVAISGAARTLNFSAAIAGATQLGTALSFPTIAAGIAAVGAVTFAVKQNADAWNDYKSRQDAANESLLSFDKNDIATKLKQISNTSGITVNSMDELNAAINEGKIILNEVTNEYEAAGSGIRDYDAEVAAASDSGGSFADAVNAVARSLGLSNDAAQDAARGFSTLAEAQEYIDQNAKEGAAAFTEYKDGLYVVTKGGFDAADSQMALAESTKEAAKSATEGSAEWKRVQDVMLESQKVANDYQVALGELAAKRYEIDVKAAVDLRVAEIQAQTQQIQAAFDATAQTIDSLTSGVSDLWSTFTGNTDRFKESKIEAAAGRMEARLDDELALKRDLTDAIVEKMRAESLRLESGEPLISIDAGTLAPELELVFDKILKYTQIKATQQGLSLLVGVV